MISAMAKANKAAKQAKPLDPAIVERATKLADVLPQFKKLPARRYPETLEVAALVTGGGTISLSQPLAHHGCLRLARPNLQGFRGECLRGWRPASCGRKILLQRKEERLSSRLRLGGKP